MVGWLADYKIETGGKPAKKHTLEKFFVVERKAFVWDKYQISMNCTKRLNKNMIFEKYHLRVL